MLTFVGMLLFFLCFLIRREQVALGLPPFLQTALGRLSFVTMWIEALARPAYRCATACSSPRWDCSGLFLSVKVLETRKWN